ncbi:preprotein translocase subunit SecY [Candidatus Azambacteria bacterium RIFCSPHIGHO2_01_FULL_40_24]|uniref:Protein translocase subunit SecY n=1 Tax=Candidatus Azambacteria bacterium RIFCSPHIGHO2_01_FULL_40_24 TaxID=1797301 RepID=A0A1F5B4Y9_9BACT|nr:MAG: preprotein translocase subunit SecY [Candidatus Azambacteria bacterium RIFCSPHIGHO2_01_FULL_40_24]
MLGKLIQIFKIKDLRNRIFFVLALLVVFRFMATIPVPGVDVLRLKSFFEGNQLFGLLNIFSGGAMDNLSIVMLGVGPYITASIIMQLLTMLIPALKELYHEEGEIGRQKFNQYTRYLTVPLAALQGYGLLVLLRNQEIITTQSSLVFFSSVFAVTAGSMFLMWLGELITEKNIGNGISLLIFAGIVSRLPIDLKQTLVTYDASLIFTYLSFIVVSIIVIAGVIIVTEGERAIPIAYAKRIRGNRIFGGSMAHLPLRVNQAGVIPIIFALSILLFPQLIAQVIGGFDIMWLSQIARSSAVFLQNQFVYGSFYFILVILFTYFYTAITFDPDQISQNLQKQGGFIPGIRPGGSTAEFIKRILNRVVLIGAIFLGTIAVLPIIVQYFTGIATLTIGGTALLIAVSVVLESMKQIKSQLIMREYEGF